MLIPFVAFARNVILARLLGPEMFGMAMILTLTAQFFDQMTDSGANKFIVQDDEGDSPRAMSMIHLVTFGRGVLIAAAMVLLAWPLANFYNQPEMAGALAFLAFAPLASGFAHWDIRRVQRHHNFLPESRTMVVSEVTGLLVSAVVAWFTRDYTAVLWGLIARWAALSLTSHFVAETPWRIGYSRDIAKRLWQFGWPLPFNGALLFFAGQGDRLLIGNQLGVRELGLYSTTLLLIFYPMSVMQRYLSVMHLPTIAQSRDDPASFRHAEDAFRGEVIGLGILMALGFTVVAPTVIYHFYGAAYAQSPLLVGMIGVLQMLRSSRAWSSTVSMGVGSSGNILAGNVIRLLAFPFGVLGVWLGDGLVGLTVGFVVGEAIALVATILLLNRQLKRRLWSGFGLILIIGLVSVTIANLSACATGVHPEITLPIGLGAAVLAAGLAIRDRAIRAAVSSAMRIARRVLARI